MAKVKPTQPAAPTGPTFEEGLIVGLLMARGSFTGDKHQPRIAIRGNDIDLLNWIKSRIGGTIAGPYSQPNRAAFYHYQLSGAAMLPVIELIGTHMPATPQRVRFQAWIAKYRAEIVSIKPRETLDCFM